MVILNYGGIVFSTLNNKLILNWCNRNGMVAGSVPKTVINVEQKDEQSGKVKNIKIV